MSTRMINALRILALSTVLLIPVTAFAGDGTKSPQGGVVTDVTGGSGLNRGGTVAIPILNVNPGTGIVITSDAVTLNMTAQSCSAGQHISAATAVGVFTCSADASGITNSAGANVITKSNGTNLVASAATDNGTTFAIGEATTVTGTLGVSGAITENTRRVFSAVGTGLAIDGTNAWQVDLNMAGGSCGAGSGASALSATGTLTCSADVTAVTNGTGISTSTVSGTATITANLAGGTCAAGSGASALSATGTLTCSADVTAVTNGTGITASTTTGTTTVTLNMTAQSCSAGQHISAATAVGVFTCTADTNPISGGTTNTLAKFTSATAIGNSTITDNGTTVVINGSTGASVSTTSVTIGGSSGVIISDGTIDEVSAALNIMGNHPNGTLSFGATGFTMAVTNYGTVAWLSNTTALAGNKTTETVTNSTTIDTTAAGRTTFGSQITNSASVSAGTNALDNEGVQVVVSNASANTNSVANGIDVAATKTGGGTGTLARGGRFQGSGSAANIVAFDATATGSSGNVGDVQATRIVTSGSAATAYGLNISNTATSTIANYGIFVQASGGASNYNYYGGGTGILNNQGAITEAGNRVYSIAGTGLTSSGATVTLNMTAQSCGVGNHISAVTAVGVFTCTADTAGASVSGTAGNSARFTSSSAVGTGAFFDNGSQVSIGIAASSSYQIQTAKALSGANGTGVKIAVSGGATTGVNAALEVSATGGSNASDFAIFATGHINISTSSTYRINNSPASAIVCSGVGEYPSWNGSAWTCTAAPSGGFVGTANRVVKTNAAANGQADTLIADNGTTLTYNSTAFTVASSTGNTTVLGTLTADGGNRVHSSVGTGLSQSGATVTLNMTAQSCSAGQHISAATAVGVFTCSADAGATPSVLTSTATGAVNDLSLAAGITAVKFTSAGTVNLRGLIRSGGNVDGDCVDVINATTSTNTVALEHENTSTELTATNRLSLPNLADWITANGAITRVCYVAGTINRWYAAKDWRMPVLFVSTGITANSMTTSAATVAGTYMQTSGTTSGSRGMYIGAQGAVYLVNEAPGAAQGSINFQWGTNAFATGYINSEGYNEGTTQQRALIVANGTGSGFGKDIVEINANQDRTTKFRGVEWQDPTIAYSFHDDLDGCPITASSVAGWPMGYIDVSTGGTTTLDFTDVTHPTVCKFNAASSTDRAFVGAAYGTTTYDRIAAGNGVMQFEASVKTGSTLCDASTDVCVFRIGFIDSSAGAPVDSISFKFNSAVSTTLWQAETCSNSVCTNTTGTGTTIATNTWYKLQITVNAAGTSADFKVITPSTGAQLGSTITIATNVPTGASRLFTPGSILTKSAGTNARFFLLDYIDFYQVLATAR